jgi:ssDNA-binding Zn-finger/Zn-ribbon topoisomerase 1
VYKLGNALPNGFFESFETLTDEQSRQALLDAWATPEQQIYNLMHTTCPTCKGQGRVVHRTKGGQAIRENCGCPQCKGTGAVLK